MKAAEVVVDVDVAVANGTVVDGTGKARFGASVGIRDGRTVGVRRSEDAALRGGTTISASRSRGSAGERWPPRPVISSLAASKRCGAPLPGPGQVR